MPYINKNSNELSQPFFLLWKEAYNQFNFEFNNFVHKDFNINNLIFLPNRKKHLKQQLGIKWLKNASQKIPLMFHDTTPMIFVQ